MLRKARNEWWNVWADSRSHEFAEGALLFDFVHRQHLMALGVVMEDGEKLVIDAAALAGYDPPAAGTDAFVVEAQRRTRVDPLTGKESSYVALGRSSLGTRLHPIAALWLWEQREALEDPLASARPTGGLADERAGVLTPWTWCVHCGRAFRDRRVALRYRRVAKWCQTCRHIRSRFLPPLRPCAADDCDRWFQPPRRNALFHSPACKSAQQRTEARVPRGNFR
jgi:hypothetical protein